MKKSVLFLIFISFGWITNAQITYQWHKKIGAIGSGTVDFLNDVTGDSAGNIYVCGRHGGAVSSDITIPYSSNSAGFYNSYIAKFDPTGNLIWAKNFSVGTAQMQLRSIAVGLDGRVFFSGDLTGAGGTGDIDPGPGVVIVGPGGVLGCLDKDGNFLWGGGLTSVGAIPIVKVRSNGDPVFAGNFANATSNIDLDYGPAVASYAAVNSGVRTGVVLMQYSASGVFQNFLIPSTTPPLQNPLIKGQPTNFLEDAIISDFELDNVGNYYVSVNMPWFSQSGTNFNFQGKESILLRWNNSGAYIGSAVWVGGSGNDVFGLVPDNLGNLYLAGTMTLTKDFDPGAGTASLNACFVQNNAGFVWKLDTAFNYKGVVKIQNNTVCASMPATEKSNAYDVAVNGADVYVVGNWTGTIDFDPGAGVQNVASVGGNDIYLLKLDTSLTYQSHVAYGGTLSATDEYGGRVFVNRSREIVMGNLYNSDIPDINPGAGTAAVTLNGGQDGLVVKYYECGVNPVITKQPITQTICEGTTLVLSVEAPGTAATFQWRKNGNNISGANSSVLTIPGFPATEAGNYSVVVGNLCNSATLTSSTVVVTATVTPTPTGSAAQTFCNSATVAGLVATGTSVKWYSAATGGTALLGTAALVNGNTYYATQTLNGCESANRLAVAVTINAPPAPTGTSNQAFCNGATLASFVLTGTNLKFYTTNTGGTALPNTTLIVNNQSYWASQTVNGCESATRFAVLAAITSVAAPTGAAIQNFCGSPTVANLVATGTGIKWYSTSTGGTPLVSTTPLVNGSVYYATQIGANNCESFNRLGVTANVFSCENGLSFDGTNDQVTLSSTINNTIGNSGTLEAWIRTSNAGSGLRALVNRPGCYALFLVDNKLTSYNYSGNGSVGATTYNGATLNDNQWHHVALTFQIGVTNGTQLYLDGQPVANPITQFILSNQTAPFVLGFNSNSQYYGGLMDRVKIWGRVLTPQEITDSYNCIVVTDTNLIANYNFNQGFPAQNNAGLFTLTDQAGTADNGTLSGFALTGATSNWVNGYTCTPNLCPTPIGVASQSFCNGATVANLVANGTNIQWYAASTGGSPLSTSAALTNGAIYYATQTVNGCESFNRLGVTANVFSCENGLSFDGTNDQVTLSSTINNTIGNSGTLEAWIRTSNAGSGLRALVNRPGCYALFLVDNKLTSYNYSGNGSVGATTYNGATLNDNQWHHVALTFQIGVTNGTQLYLDGQPVANPITQFILSNQTAPFVLGFNSNSQYYGGLMDRVKIWGRVLTPQEITDSYNCIVVTDTNLIANYNFNQGFPAQNNAGLFTLTDQAGTADNGTLSGFALTGATSNWVNGYTCTPNLCPTPIGVASQSFCNGATVANLVANGTNIQWYAASTGGSPLSTSAALTNGAIYYATQTVNGCESANRLAVTVTINTAPNAAITPATVSICSGQSTSLTASGGSTYTWSNSGGSNAVATFSPNTNTTYTVTVTGANGCTAIASRLISVNAIPTAAISPATVTICNGQSITLTASGGGTYAWSNSGGSNATATFSPTTNTTYTVTVTGANSCTATVSRLVTVNSNPTANVQPATVTICSGQSTSLTASGGGTYTWSNSGGSNAQATFSPTTNTTYTVTVTGANSCTAIASGLVTVNAAPTASISPATVSICSGQSTTLTANGGGTYAWSNSGGSNAVATFSPTTNITYTVTVTGANSCTSTASRLVTVNENPVAAISPSTVNICDGQSATLTASGGTSYTWSNSGGSNAQATFSPTTNTAYTVTVVDGNLCSATASRLVTVNANPTVVISPSTVAICSGQSATLTASGGGTYAWSNSGGSTAAATFSPTANTTYSVTVTGANNCTATASRLVTVNALPTAAILPATITICNGESATLTASGGGTYAWSNTGGSTAAATFSPTTNTTYSVTVTGTNNCTVSASRLVTVNALPTASISPLSPSICEGTSQTLTANGGGTYAWSNGLGSGATKTVSPTTNTTYTVTVTNAANCTTTAASTVVVNTLPNAQINGPTTICSGLQAILTASGGSSYSWSNSGGSNAQVTFTPTQTTTYTVTVTSAANCTATASQTVSVQTSPTATITGPSSVCSGNSITLTANGGNSYAWSNGSNTAAITVSPTSTTTYTVTVSIGANCSATASQTVTFNTTPTASISPSIATICNGESATLTATGGGTYVWSNSGGSNAAATFSPTSNTTYTVTITAANNCSATASRLVTVNANPTAAISPTTITICNGESATITASGGGTYTWSNSGGSNASAAFSPSTNTTYTVTVTNANNCTATASRLVTVNANPTAAVNPTTASICEGASQTLTATGGGTYAWSNGLGSGATKTVSPITSTTYTVTVTNAANCTATATSAVTVNALPNVQINGPTTICSGLSATLTASGGGTYAWSNSATTATITVSPTQTTTYTVTVTGTGNCTATASQNVSVQSAPTATISGVASVCAGSSTTLTANGGNTYAWANGLGANAAITVSPTTATTYTVTVSIGANCSATASQTITVKQPTTTTQSETICQGKVFSFKGQSLTQSGVYKDTLVNAVGCDSVITLNLTVTPALQETINQTLCFGESLSFNGQTISQSGAYKDTVQTAGGCDSIITLSVTVFNKIEQIINASICTGQSYNFDGQSLTQAGQYFDTLQTTLGCDSFITLNLAVNSFVTGSVSKAICQGETLTFNGQDLTQQGQYLDTLISTGGCDSILTLTLTVNSLPQPTIIQSGFDLSTQTFTSYQWQLNNNDISNSDNQSYTATQNGNYTVVVTDDNGCSNTSGVVNVIGVGILDVVEFDLHIYPNPTNSTIDIQTEATIETIKLYNLQGQVVMNSPSNTTQIDLSNLAEGAYLIHVKTATGTARRTILKQ